MSYGARGIPNHKLGIHFLAHEIPLTLLKPSLDPFHHDIHGIRSHGFERLAHRRQGGRAERG